MKKIDVFYEPARAECAEACMIFQQAMSSGDVDAAFAGLSAGLLDAHGFEGVSELWRAYLKFASLLHVFMNLMDDYSYDLAKGGHEIAGQILLKKVHVLTEHAQDIVSLVTADTLSDLLGKDA